MSLLRYFDWISVNNRKPTVQQITDFLHIDFHVGDFDSEFHVGGRYHDRLEDLFYDTRDNTLCVFIIDVRTLKCGMGVVGNYNKRRPTGFEGIHIPS